MESHKLTTAEAAAFLGVAPGTMKAWRSRGQGPPYQQPGGPGTTPLYDLRALEIFKVVRGHNEGGDK